jgi:hypothetical protein
MMTSDLNVCTLEYRTAAIRTDGTGLIQTNASGEIEWTDWLVSTSYLASDCANTYTPDLLANTAYQFRLSSVDHAGRASEVFTSSNLIFNLHSVFRPGANDIDQNTPFSNIQNNIIHLFCNAQRGCYTPEFVTGTKRQGLEVNTYRVCLAINGTDVEKCQYVTSSIAEPVEYEFYFRPDEFPATVDVFIGGTLTTTLISSSGIVPANAVMSMSAMADASDAVSFSSPFNVVVFIHRDNPPINAAPRLQSYVQMRNGELNR